MDSGHGSSLCIVDWRACTATQLSGVADYNVRLKLRQQVKRPSVGHSDQKLVLFLTININISIFFLQISDLSRDLQCHVVNYNTFFLFK